MSPVLSIVVPAFNAEQFIDGCLASIRRALDELPADQRARIEVIFCDNHSTDTTRELAEGFVARCSYRIIQPPEHYENRTRNWHHAISAAIGEWVMMLHADDLLAPSALRGILRATAHRRAKRAVLLSGRIRGFTDPSHFGRLRPVWPFPSLISGETLRHRVLPLLCPFVPFTPMRRSAYEKVGGLNFDYELVQDLDLWIRMLAEGDVFYFPFELGYWREHPFSEKYARTFASEHMRLATRLRSLIPGLSPALYQQVAEVAHAKATVWLSREDADQLADEAGEIFAAFRPLVSDQHGAQEFLRKSERSVGRLLYLLRGSGVFANAS